MAKDPGDCPDMPSSPFKQPSELLAEAHEDRIQRLEQTVSDTVTKVATIEQKIDSGFQYLAEKMESTMKPVAERLQQHVEDDKELGKKIGLAVDQIDNNSQRLEKIEDRASRRKAMWETVRKGGWAVLLVFLGTVFKACFDHTYGK